MSAPSARNPIKPRNINLRTSDLMTAVQEQVESHYRSFIVERILAKGGILTIGSTTLRLAKRFGFCFGVERAIDLAYAARKAFPSHRVFILGEIIHNPLVNEQISAMGIKNLLSNRPNAGIEELTADDIVIVPAFGADLETLKKLRERGCQFVDTTCGEVMSVWKQVRLNATEGLTSIIHGKAEHEETKATASRARALGSGHYLIVRTLKDTDYVCNYIRHGGDRQDFMDRFKDACSSQFDPDLHLTAVGVANQTTMLQTETEEIQRRIRAAIIGRDGPELGVKHFRSFDTICVATQRRQDALADLLRGQIDLLLVVGGYNSSNTSHLVEMGEAKVPTYFVLGASALQSANYISHYSLHEKRQIVTENWIPATPLVIGMTTGASCPNSLLEDTILRLYELRGVPSSEVLAHSTEVSSQRSFPLLGQTKEEPAAN